MKKNAGIVRVVSTSGVVIHVENLYFRLFFLFLSVSRSFPWKNERNHKDKLNSFLFMSYVALHTNGKRKIEKFTWFNISCKTKIC